MTVKPFMSFELRSVLFKHLKNTFGFAPELDDVPTKFAAVFVDDETLEPGLVFEKFFLPELIGLTDDAYSIFELLSSDERKESMKRCTLGDYESRYKAPTNSLELLYDLCRTCPYDNQSALNSADAKDYWVVKQSASYSSDLEVTSEEYIDSFVRFVDIFPAHDKNFIVSPDVFSAALNEAHDALFSSLAVGAAISDVKGKHVNRDVVHRFDEALKFYCYVVKEFRAVKG